MPLRTLRRGTAACLLSHPPRATRQEGFPSVRQLPKGSHSHSLWTAPMSRRVGSFSRDLKGRLVASTRRFFSTALRAACEDSDPYFSLDPDNIAAWLADTQQAESELDEAIKRDQQWHFQKPIHPDAPGILEFRTISASRDYPKFWNSALGKYPSLRSRLVFRPGVAAANAFWRNHVQGRRPTQRTGRRSYCLRRSKVPRVRYQGL